MFDAFIFVPLVFGLGWYALTPSDDSRALAWRFIIWWGAGIVGLVIGAVIGGTLMPGGPNSSAEGPMILVGLIWLVSITTMLWTLIATSLKALQQRCRANDRR